MVVKLNLNDAAEIDVVVDRENNDEVLFEFFDVDGNITPVTGGVFQINVFKTSKDTVSIASVSGTVQSTTNQVKFLLGSLAAIGIGSFYYKAYQTPAGSSKRVFAKGEYKIVN